MSDVEKADIYLTNIAGRYWWCYRLGKQMERSQYQEKPNVCSGERMLVGTLLQKHFFLERKVSFGDPLRQIKLPLSNDEAILTRPNIWVQNNLIRILINYWQGNGWKVCKTHWKNHLRLSRLEGVERLSWVLAKRRKRWGRGGAPLWLIAGGGTFTTLLLCWPWSLLTSKLFSLLTVCI